MSQPKIISEKPMDIYQVKSALADIEANGGELNFRSQKTKEYVESITQMDVAKAAEIKDKILALEIPRFKEENVCKIIDVNPVSLDDLKQLVSSFDVTVKDDYLKQILEILKA